MKLSTPLFVLLLIHQAAAFWNNFQNIHPVVKFENPGASNGACTPSQTAEILNQMKNTITEGSLYGLYQGQIEFQTRRNLGEDVEEDETEEEDRELIRCPAHCRGGYFCRVMCGRGRHRELAFADALEDVEEEDRELWVSMWAELLRLDMESACWKTVKYMATEYEHSAPTCSEALSASTCSAYV